MSKCTTAEALKQLRRLVGRLESAVIGYSGGVDSTLLAAVAHDELGRRCIAVTFSSELQPVDELERATRLAGDIGIAHKVIPVKQLDIPGFCENPPERCYLCKRDLFGRLRELADRLGFRHVADGTNADDAHEHRPGMAATAELNVVSPLRDAGLTKEMVRRLSRELGLSTWDQPTSPCLATRFPYGVPLTPEAIKRVALAEATLRALGLRDVRVRAHEKLARIEVDPRHFEMLTGETTRKELVQALRKLGFDSVTLDLQGYRSGSMDEPPID